MADFDLQNNQESNEFNNPDRQTCTTCLLCYTGCTKTSYARTFNESEKGN